MLVTTILSPTFQKPQEASFVHNIILAELLRNGLDLDAKAVEQLFSVGATPDQVPGSDLRIGV